jgi:peptidoglycan/LPS O-acetylase OafA/YrhL
MSKRLAEFDLIRAAAALAVIAIHVTAGYMDSPLAYVWNHLVRFAVPLFIVISGFLLYWTDHEAESLKYLPAAVFYRQRLHRILVPYILWTVIYCLLNFYLLRLLNHPLLLLTTLGKALLLGNAYYHLYFIPIILQLYLLYPWLRRWMKREGRSLLWAAGLLTGTCQILLYLYLLRIISLPGQYSFWYLCGFPVWLFYFVFGMFAAGQLVKGNTAASVRKESRGKRKVWGSGLVWLVSLGIMLADSKLTGVQGSIIRPSVILYTLGSYYFFYALADWWLQAGKSWVGWLSGQSFLIYLMHPFILTVLLLGVHRLGYPNLWAGNAGMVALYGLTTLTTLAATYLISRTPLVRILGGL